MYNEEDVKSRENITNDDNNYTEWVPVHTAAKQAQEIHHTEWEKDI